MRSRNRITRVAIVSLLLLVVFQSFGLGSGLSGVVYAKPQPPSDTPDSGRFIPYINAPQLPVGSWKPQQSKAPHLTDHPATSKPSASGRGVGEQSDLRGVASSTFLNSDGTWTLKSYTVPIHYQDAQGNWQPIDDTVVSDNSVVGYGYGNKANSWQAHFASTAEGSKLLHLRYPGLNVAEALNGAAPVAATTNGSQVTYPGVFPGVDLLYFVGNSHLEETLLLQNAQTPESYSFTYHVPGVTAQQDAAGNINFLERVMNSTSQERRDAARDRRTR